MGLYPFDRDGAAVMGGRMYPLTLEGLDRAMRELGRCVTHGENRVATLVSGNPRVVCLRITERLTAAQAIMCARFSRIEFSGVRRVGVIECLAVNILGVLGQMFSDTRGQIGVRSVGHGTSTLLLALNEAPERVRAVNE